MSSIKKLCEIIKASNINLSKYYQKLSRNPTDRITLKEFSEMVKLINNQISEEDARAVFLKFDSNNNGLITFKEFCDTLDFYNNTINNLGFSTTNYSTNDKGA